MNCDGIHPGIRRDFQRIAHRMVAHRPSRETQGTADACRNRQFVGAMAGDRTAVGYVRHSAGCCLRQTFIRSARRPKELTVAAGRSLSPAVFEPSPIRTCKRAIPYSSVRFWLAVNQRLA